MSNGACENGLLRQRLRLNRRLAVVLAMCCDAVWQAKVVGGVLRWEVANPKPQVLSPGPLGWP